VRPEPTAELLVQLADTAAEMCVMDDHEIGDIVVAVALRFISIEEGCEELLKKVQTH
jgi:hypothetical protein